MRVDALAVRLRPRSPMEAADLGVRLCQGAAGSVYPALLVAAAPMTVVAILSSQIAAWLPPLVIWLAKPWLDCTILFALSRAAFGQPTSPGDVWRTRGAVWWRPLLLALVVQRLSPWRALSQPVYQLEGSSVWAARHRVRQLCRRRRRPAILLCTAFSLCEYALWIGLLSLVFWFSPRGWSSSVANLIYGSGSALLAGMSTVAYGVVVLFLEPFFVATGFAMYLNRRAELEAWDIEQEFRRVFAA